MRYCKACGYAVDLNNARVHDEHERQMADADGVPRLPHDSPPYDPPSRYEWSYIDNLRARATEWGTVNEPHVQRLLAKLEAGARLRHGERP